MKTAYIITVVLSLGLIMGVVLISPNNSSGKIDGVGNANNVTVESGKQVVLLRAKVGYSPRTSVAKAGLPTVLRINTDGTFDCSSTVRIPSMNISRNLPQTGTTDIDLGTQLAGTLKGTCGMGMYPFEIQFN